MTDETNGLILEAVTSFVSTGRDGELINVCQGDTIAASHPWVRGREDLFKPFEPTHLAPVREAKAPRRARA